VGPGWLDRFRIGSIRSNDEVSARSLRKAAKAAIAERARAEERRLAAHDAGEHQAKQREKEREAQERQAARDALVTACETHLSSFLSTLDAHLVAAAKGGGTRLVCELGIHWRWWQTKLGDRIDHHEHDHPSRPQLEETLSLCPSYSKLRQTCRARGLGVALNEIRKEEPHYDDSQWGRGGTARWVLALTF
jgi:hypothetical protein